MVYFLTFLLGLKISFINFVLLLFIVINISTLRVLKRLTSIVYFLVSTNKASSYCHLAVISDIIFEFLQRFLDSHEQEYKTSGR